MSKEEFYDDEDSLYEDELETECPKCGRDYDEIDYEYQICSKCGWNVEKGKFEKSRKPKKADYMNGDADILTGQWF